jgi:hypothetical protein
MFYKNFEGSQHLVEWQYVRRPDTQHNDIQHNDTQHNDTQHNNIQHNNK